LGDALEILKQLPSDSVDLIFADPPYRLSNGGITVQSGRMVSVNKGEWDVSEGPTADFAFHEAWLAECHRVLEPNGTLWVSGTYHSIYMCGFAMQKLGYRILNEVSWFKPNAAPNLGRRMFTASHETLIWASKSPKSKHVFNYDAMREGEFGGDALKAPGKQMRSVWSIPPARASEKTFGRHPTQKPIDLLNRVVIASSNEGQLVLDPFCGSGTTGEAALVNRRRFIGIDNNEGFIRDVALPRLRAI
jgi:site-specific DNA-methyltransferase (adenine-specific)